MHKTVLKFIKLLHCFSISLKLSYDHLSEFTGSHHDLMFLEDPSTHPPICITLINFLRLTLISFNI